MNWRKSKWKEAASPRQMNLKQVEGSLFLQCLTPAGSEADRGNVGGDINKKREMGAGLCGRYTGLPLSFCPFSSTNPSTNPLQARAIKSPRWALLGR